MRPSEEDHLVRPNENSEQLGLTVNDEFFFDSTSMLVNSSQEDTVSSLRVFDPIPSFHQAALAGDPGPVRLEHLFE